VAAGRPKHVSITNLFGQEAPDSPTAAEPAQANGTPHQRTEGWFQNTPGLTFSIRPGRGRPHRSYRAESARSGWAGSYVLRSSADLTPDRRAREMQAAMNVIRIADHSGCGSGNAFNLAGQHSNPARKRRWHSGMHDTETGVPSRRSEQLRVPRVSARTALSRRHRAPYS
jgi:hypothetical protein